MHQVDIPKEAFKLVLEFFKVASSKATLLTKEVCGGFVNVFREARDLCIGGDDNGVDLITEERDCFSNDINSATWLTLSRCLLHALPEEEVSVH